MTSMSKAYATSGKIFEQVSMKAAPGMYEQLKHVKEGELVVVRGQYDHIENLLPALKVPFEIIDPEDIKSHNGGRVLFLNCKTYGTSAPTEKALETFVEEGGRLVTTDWSLSAVAHTFPKKLKHVATTGDEVVEIQCHTDIARRLIGLNYAQCHPQWWLEGSSHVYDIGQGVIPLITSEELKERHTHPYIAAAFSHGDGEVVHFISHLELQRTRLKNKWDKKGLDDFLEKVGASKTANMDEMEVAKLEAAFSTLNTLAYLCIPMPILPTSMNSVTVKSNGKDSEHVMTSKRLV